MNFLTLSLYIRERIKVKDFATEAVKIPSPTIISTNFPRVQIGLDAQNNRTGTIVKNIHKIRNSLTIGSISQKGIHLCAFKSK